MLIRFHLEYKPGSCPDKSSIQATTCNVTCSHDLECADDQKCCPSSCATSQCMLPKSGKIWFKFANTVKKKIATFDFTKDLVPIIEEFKDGASVFKGETLVLPCKVSGYPLPTVTWFRNHQEIQFKTQSSTERVRTASNNSLIISDVSDEDEGIYSCRATNSFGKAVVKECNVIVKGKYSPILIQRFNSKWYFGSTWIEFSTLSLLTFLVSFLVCTLFFLFP